MRFPPPDVDGSKPEHMDDETWERYKKAVARSKAEGPAAGYGSSVDPDGEKPEQWSDAKWEAFKKGAARVKKNSDAYKDW